MLDKKLKLMLETAATLTADDLDCLRGLSSPAEAGMADESEARATAAGEHVEEGSHTDEHPASDDASPATPVARTAQTAHRKRAAASPSSLSAGEYERQRTRESKVSTACIGRERDKHDWWSIGTMLVAHIGSETFTATVVENMNVKSNRSLLITSGPANGRICITPTRAAMEATEAYRQAHNLGRGGGVTNGWEFWRAQA